MLISLWRFVHPHDKVRVSGRQYKLLTVVNAIRTLNCKFKNSFPLELWLIKLDLWGRKCCAFRNNERHRKSRLSSGPVLFPALSPLHICWKALQRSHPDPYTQKNFRSDCCYMHVNSLVFRWESSDQEPTQSNLYPAPNTELERGTVKTAPKAEQDQQNAERSALS